MNSSLGSFAMPTGGWLSGCTSASLNVLAPCESADDCPEAGCIRGECASPNRRGPVDAGDAEGFAFPLPDVTDIDEMHDGSGTGEDGDIVSCGGSGC